MGWYNTQKEQCPQCGVDYDISINTLEPEWFKYKKCPVCGIKVPRKFTTISKLEQDP